MNGEGGHMCSLGCTLGLIRALQQYGSEDLRRQYLPKLLQDDFDLKLHATEFLSEIQGGSDVGANTLQAQLRGDSWFIHGNNNN
jgi:alkylation response protein AidB-like acyl-CoA dehydrogenase